MQICLGASAKQPSFLNYCYFTLLKNSYFYSLMSFVTVDHILSISYDVGDYVYNLRILQSNTREKA